MTPVRLLTLITLSCVLAWPCPVHAKTYGNSSHYQSSYSSRSSSGSSSGRSYSAPAARPTYTRGDSSSSGSSHTGYRSAARSSDFDAPAAHDSAVARSKRDYEAAHARTAGPAPARSSYADVLRPMPPVTRANPSSYDDASYWRGRFDQQTFQTRRQRYYSAFGPTYVGYTGSTYHDWIAPAFFGWLLAQSVNTRGYWAYHHRYDIDAYRYDAMIADPAVAAVVYGLEAQGLARQRYYVPGNFSADLMYNDAYFQSFANLPPPVRTVAAPAVMPVAVVARPGLGAAFWVWGLVGVLFFFIGAVLLGLGVMLVLRHFARRGRTSGAGLPPGVFPGAGGASPASTTTLNNPLKLSLGDALQINDIDHSQLPFNVESMAEWDRDFSQSGGSLRKFTDYDLVARQLHAQPVSFRLRLNPTPEKEAHGISQRLLLLERTDQQKWTQELEDILREDKGFREFDDKGQLESEWWRLNDAHESYLADVTTLSRRASGSSNGDTRRAKIEYWDFYHDMPVAGSDEKVREYLFVEMNKATGWFEFWKGHELDQSEIQ